MKAVSLALDDFDLVVHPFQFAGMDRVITVVEDAVAVTLDPAGRSGLCTANDGAKPGIIFYFSSIIW